MKSVIKTSLTILFCWFMVISCKKNSESPLLLEISPGNESAIIQKQIGQLEFTFSLLNKEGLPSTVFNETENFTFRFSFKNNSIDTITVTTEFINSNFFRVFLSLGNLDEGKPWTGIWCEFNLGPQVIKLAPSSSFQLRCPWILSDNNYPDYPLCMSESKAPLMNGEYNTSINLDFHYSAHGKTTIIDNLKFKINFLVK
jgi:hypothetical protein